MAENTSKTRQGRPETAVAVREPNAVDKPEGMTTGQKIAVGAGITGAAGLAGFGLYRLGAHMGWWGTGGMIVIDEPDGEDGKDGKDGNDGKDGKSSGGSTGRGRAIGKPPNISGDPQGYNTEQWSRPGPVRLALIFLGYKVAANDETLVPNGQPNGEVMRFQREWNKVIRGLDSGRVKLPADVEAPSKYKQLRGLLAQDGIPGKNTLNALEIAFNNTLKNLVMKKMKWSSLVGQA